ncbi:MAG: uroporphyrinogen-III synthase [Steroidobacteraceae bacterium]
MIPYLVPPLQGLSILVTRPALQSDALNTRFVSLGAQVMCLPAIDIASCNFQLPTTHYDLLIFISSNAVRFSRAVLVAHAQARIAAVGTSTAQALIDAGYQVDITPQLAANSETLLSHPLLQTPPAKILIVRGIGGRELLRNTLIERGSEVDVLEVYRRQPSQPDPAQLQAIQFQLQSDALTVITLTSVAIVQSLHTLLGTAITAPQVILLAGSTRIARAAQQLGWQGEIVLAYSPEDVSLVAALTRWHTRARNELIR